MTCDSPASGLPSGPPAARPGGGTGPLRNGNPRGNPNLAPRCGAKARSGNPCRAPAMTNGRCRMHGGKCKGPRTPEGMARSIAAHTTHGKSTAAKRAVQRYVRTLAARMRLISAAMRLQEYLPAEMAARLSRGPAELKAPDKPSQVASSKNADPMSCNAGHRALVPVVRDGAAATGRAAAAGRAGGAARPALRVRDVERQAALAEANGQAPWRQAIALARAAKRAARAGAAKRTRRMRAKGGATRIARSDLMQTETEGLVRATPPSPASLRDATLVRSSRPKPAGRARCTFDIARSDLMQRENRRGCGGSGNGGGRHGTEGGSARSPGAWLGRPLTRQALVCSSRPKPEAPERCTLHIARSKLMHHEKRGVPRLARLNPTKAMAPRGTTPAGTRGPSVFETLYAELRRAVPPPGWRVPQASPR